jgi:hypothetical protein
MDFIYYALKKLIILLLFVFSAGHLVACSCDFLTVEEAVKVIPIIFSGEVTSITKVPLSETFLLDSITNLENRLVENDAEWFIQSNKVHRVEFSGCNFLKGKYNEESFTVYTPIGSSTCEYRFLEKETYVVYADYNNFFPHILMLYNIGDIQANTKLPWTHLCMRNTTDIEEEKRKITKEIEIVKSFFQREYRKSKNHILKQFRKAMRD